MKVWRQGDIYISSVERIPEHCLPWRSRILVRGELTGHAHRIEAGADVAIFQEVNVDEERPGVVLYLSVRGPEARIVHEEHGPVALPQGEYRVWRQREFNPIANRTVLD